jgi:hypothetical protein
VSGRRTVGLLLAASLYASGGTALGQTVEPGANGFCGPEWNVYGCPAVEGQFQWHASPPVLELHPQQWGGGVANSAGGISGDNTPGGIAGDNSLGGISGDNTPGGISGDNTPGGIPGP